MNENQFGVLLENILDKVNVIAEGQIHMGTRLDRIETRLDNVEIKLDNIDMRLDVVETRLDNVETRLGNLESDMKVVKTFVMAADVTFNDHENRIKTLEKKAANS